MRSECVGCPYATEEARFAPVAAFDGDLVLSPGSKLLRSRDVSVRIDQKQLLILSALMRFAGRVQTRDRIALAMWGADGGPESLKVIDVHISKLRKAMRAVGMPFEIFNTHGVGFRIDRAA